MVSPRLGKGGSYRSMDKVLSIPNHYYANFARWNQLALMKGSGDLKELRELARVALDPAPLETFIDIVERDLGFALYRAVSSAKMAFRPTMRRCSTSMAMGSISRADITRGDFERWIADDVARIAATRRPALEDAGVATGEIERVFLTGGTSFVPAIRRLFVDRFGANIAYLRRPVRIHRLWAGFDRTKRGSRELGRCQLNATCKLMLAE